jgi:hypothetical protein
LQEKETEKSIEPLPRAHGSAAPVTVPRGVIGASSTIGPLSGADLKDDDFALAGRVQDAAGRLWHIACVADGLTTAIWAKAGAEMACNAFRDALRLVDAPFSREDDGPLRDQLASVFHEMCRDRFEQRLKRIFESKELPPDWTGDSGVYSRAFLAHARGLGRAREQWFTTTLVAAAITWNGRHGTLVVLGMGDGFVRIDRQHGRAVTRKDVTRAYLGEGRDKFHPPHVLRVDTDKDEVRGCLHIAPLDGTDDAVAVLVATDGVSCSSAEGIAAAMTEAGLAPDGPEEWNRTPLNYLVPTGETDAGCQDSCSRFLSCLEHLPERAGFGRGSVDADNMSLAYVKVSLKDSER